MYVANFISLIFWKYLRPNGFVQMRIHTQIKTFKASNLKIMSMKVYSLIGKSILAMKYIDI